MPLVLLDEALALTDQLTHLSVDCQDALAQVIQRLTVRIRGGRLTLQR